MIFGLVLWTDGILSKKIGYRAFCIKDAGKAQDIFVTSPVVNSEIEISVGTVKSDRHTSIMR